MPSLARLAVWFAKNAGGKRMLVGMAAVNRWILTSLLLQCLLGLERI